MFTQIAALASATPLSLTISVDKEGAMTVVVIPQGAEGPLSQPLSLTAMPSELDAEFGTIINGFTASRQTLTEQLAAVQDAMKAAGKQATVAAAKQAKKGGNNKAAIQVASVSSDADNDEDEDELDGNVQSHAPAESSESKSTQAAGESEDPLSGLFKL